MVDQQLFNWFHAFAGVNRILDLLAIFIAEYLGYLMIAVALYVIFTHKEWRIRYYNFLSVALTVLLARGFLAELIKVIYSRPRPFIALNFVPLAAGDVTLAFPSGHASFYFALASAIYFLSPRWGIRLGIGALVMGMARVFIGVHWPLDIVGGALIGWVSAQVIRNVLPPLVVSDESHATP